MERPDSQSLEVGIAGPGITLFRLQDEVELHMEDVKSFKNNNPSCIQKLVNCEIQ